MKAITEENIVSIVAGLPQSEPIEPRRQGTFGFAIPYGGMLRVIAKEVAVKYRPYKSHAEWKVIPAGECVRLASGGPFEFLPEEPEVHYIDVRQNKAA
jgi:hypothetical protein